MPNKSQVFSLPFDSDRDNRRDSMNFNRREQGASNVSAMFVNIESQASLDNLRIGHFMQRVAPYTLRMSKMFVYVTDLLQQWKSENLTLKMSTTPCERQQAFNKEPSWVWIRKCGASGRRCLICLTSSQKRDRAYSLFHTDRRKKLWTRNDKKFWIS